MTSNNNSIMTHQKDISQEKTIIGGFRSKIMAQEDPKLTYSQKLIEFIPTDRTILPEEELRLN